MKAAICQICGQKGLIPHLGEYKPWKDDGILCENEGVIHFIRHGNHYLAHTQENVIEEIGERKLVLN